ncbi:MAG: 8-hydroxy-5-deazaflavin:NADPH oxidoreductase [Acidimicrobiaceae bacterium]|nr:8-hydroxy-5-deazaflavin:NADPH oxidoreductase [Acidimicrobiaceae bacterium]
MHIGVLGGTGPAGQGFALRLASVGFTVTVGSRSQERATEICTKLCDQWSGRDLKILPGDNAAAADAELVVVATPWDAAAPTVSAVADRLGGKVVLSMANALVRVGHEFVPLIPPRGSVAAWVQAAVPKAMVAAAMHHVPARELAELDHQLLGDVLVCSDHPAATDAVSELIAALPKLRPLDAGMLSSASAIEALTPVLLQINSRYKTRAGIQLTNIDLG